MAFSRLAAAPAAALLAWLAASAAAVARADAPAIDARQPVALAAIDDGARVAVACRRSGHLVVVDARALAVESAVALGAGLSDVAALRGARVAVADVERHEVILAAIEPGGARPLDRAAVSHSPASLAVSPDGRRIAAAGLWARRIDVLEVLEVGDAGDGGGAASLARRRSIDLPFAPRRQVFAPDGRLIVADAFGGRIAVVDSERGAVAAIATIPGHNIGDLAMTRDGARVSLALQRITNTGRAGERSPRGFAVANLLVHVSIDALAAPGDAAAISPDAVLILDDDRGAADPGALARLPSGELLVALAGADEVAVVGASVSPRLPRHRVGRAPQAIAVTGDGAYAVAAASLDDAVDVIDLAAGASAGVIRLAPARERRHAELGESLFRDARLSGDGRLTCQSCHTDGHSSGILTDTRGDGTLGTPKRVLPLGGVGETGPWGWNGGVAYLDNQIARTLSTTMDGPGLDDASVNAIGDFLRALRPAPSLARARGALDEEAAKRGAAIFTDLGCVRCHEPPELTTPARYDVGLKDEAGLRRFNPPSLRGASQRDGLFHDNRASRLEDIQGRFAHRVDAPLSGETLRDLTAFLAGL